MEQICHTWQLEICHHAIVERLGKELFKQLNMIMQDLEIREAGLPNGEAVFNRVNVILGSNGTGKFKLLKMIKARLGQPQPGTVNHTPAGIYYSKTLYIEGGRTVTVNGSLGKLPQGITIDTLQNFESQYKQAMTDNLSKRIEWTFRLLEKKSHLMRLEYSDEMAKLADKGYDKAMPKRETPPLLKLFALFNDIFPSIDITYEEGSKQFKCSKDNGAAYDINSLSDGEKQVLAILADIRLLAPQDSLIIIDEPEVNLNPSLAIKLWETIENDLPSCRFIYSTHSVGFAIRDNVDKIIILSENPTRSKEINKISDIAKSDLANLLGSIPAILARSNALIVEGKPNSFDPLFYRWLINNKDTEVLPMGNCEEVKAVVTRQGVWEAIASSVTIYGIIDRDFKDEEEVSSNNSSYYTLYFHEAESYLCNPKIVAAIAAGVSIADPPPTEDEIKKFILKEFEKQLLHIAAKRVFAKAKIRLGVSIGKEVLKEIDDEQTLKEVLVAEAQKEVTKAGNAIGSIQVTNFLDQELELCKKALREENIDLILRLMPGKELLNNLSRKAGCPNAQGLCNAAKRHINIDEFEELTQLRSRLNSTFQRTI